MSSKPEPRLWSHDTGQQIPYFKVLGWAYGCTYGGIRVQMYRWTVIWQLMFFRSVDYQIC